MKPRFCTFVYLVLLLSLGAALAEAQNVKITPLGQRNGEFCNGDRALLFEDPTGVRILYDPGNTVAGGADSRLGPVHAILLSHAHGDHLGTAKLSSDPNAGGPGCANTQTVTATNSNLAEIAAEKNSAVLAGGNLASFIGLKITNIRGTTTAGCPTSGLTNESTVPRTAPCTASVGLGAKRTIRLLGASSGVQVTAVHADHPNDAPSQLLIDPERTELSSNATSAYLGLANGFVVTFTNGLRVYLSGDTGLTSDMSTIVHGYYNVQLAVLNVGDIFSTGPEEGAFAVTELIRPNAVIPSHVNESATSNGVVQSGTKTALFIDLLTPGKKSDKEDHDDDDDDKPGKGGAVSVIVPLSGVTLELDARARCVVGCRNR